MNQEKTKIILEDLQKVVKEAKDDDKVTLIVIFIIL